MSTRRVTLDPRRAGSMNNRVDPTQHWLGMLTKMLNIDLGKETWKRRFGWKKLASCPCDSFIGIYAYKDTHQTVHVLALGDDGNCYHDLDGFAAPVVMYDAVSWNGTYRATFAARKDDCFIAIGSQLGVGKNLRYDGLSGVLYGVSLDTPTAAPTATVTLGAGDIGAGDFLYRYAFYDADTSWESDWSPAVLVTVPPGPAVSEVQTLTVVGGPSTAGNWYLILGEYRTRELEWDESLANIQAAIEELPTVGQGNVAVAGAALDAGGPMRFTFAGALGNLSVMRVERNELEPAAMTLPIAETTAGATETDADASIALAGIQVYANASGAGAAHGRTIYRRIYRSDDGQPWARPTGDVAELANDAGGTWTDTNAATHGSTLIRQPALQVFSHVVAQQDGLTIWLGDVTNNAPTAAYWAYDIDHPETPGPEPEIAYVGDDSDPVTAVMARGDGILVGKLRAIHYLPRRCTGICEAMTTGAGMVSQASTVSFGGRVAFMSLDGPRYITHALEGDVAFAGTNPKRFCLADTWAQVKKDRLKYASALHDPIRGVVEWYVQRCDWSGVSGAGGPHNDTTIVWYYTLSDAKNPGGIVEIYTGAPNCACMVPGASTLQDKPYGAYPLGYIGEMYEGDHGDGMDSWVTGTVVAASGTQVVVSLDQTVADGALKGTVLYADSGTGTHVCRDVGVCDLVGALIVNDEQGSAGRVLTTATALTLDTTSTVVLGGFPFVLEGMLPSDDPDTVNQYLRAELIAKGPQ